MAGVDDFVPVLFVYAYFGLVTAWTFPFRASFYLASDMSDSLYLDCSISYYFSASFFSASLSSF